MTREALLSIHDVGPETLSRVEELVELTRRHRIPAPTLLVVPGKDWSPGELDVLRAFSAEGCRLAGHGWVHQAPPPATVKHRVHALVLSRDQGEHLSRPRAELVELVRRCHGWFGDHDLPAPELYVPPAWAMGALRHADLPALPFRWYEDLAGLVDARTGRRRWLPLAGFEADTRFRQGALRLVNAACTGLGTLLRRPVRVSIHPHDLELLLADDLRALLAREWRWVDEAEVMGGGRRSVRVEGRVR